MRIISFAWFSWNLSSLYSLYLAFVPLKYEILFVSPSSSPGVRGLHGLKANHSWLARGEWQYRTLFYSESTVRNPCVREKLSTHFLPIRSLPKLLSPSLEDMLDSGDYAVFNGWLVNSFQVAPIPHSHFCFHSTFLEKCILKIIASGCKDVSLDSAEHSNTDSCLCDLQLTMIWARSTPLVCSVTKLFL